MDLQTLYTIVATTALMLGAIQVAVFATRRFGRWPLWWGCSNLLVALGDYGIVMQPHLSPVFAGIRPVGYVVVIASYVLLIGGVRDFVGRRLQAWSVILSALVAAAVLWLDTPQTSGLRGGILSGYYMTIELAIAFESGRLARDERLHSGWIMMGAFLASAAMFLTRGLLFALGVFGSGGHGADLNAMLGVPFVVSIVLRGMVLVLLATERSNARLARLAYEDPLTGALTRNGLRERRERLLARTAGDGLPAAVLLMDVDRFKAVNDKFGHEVGDRILGEVADAVRSALSDQGLFARWGGDEFLIVLPRTDMAAGLATAERIRSRLAADIPVEASLVRPTLSIGIAQGDLKTESLSRLVHRADAALYAVKRSGRDGARVYDGDIELALTPTDGREQAMPDNDLGTPVAAAL